MEAYENAKIIFNKHMNHIHIECGNFDYIEDYYYKQEFFNSLETKFYNIHLEHSDTCPNRAYRIMCQNSEVAVIHSEKNVRLAVCMAVFDAEGKILLTRRNASMRVFPHAWVMPGGHIDLGESLEEGVIREILEETGI